MFLFTEGEDGRHGLVGSKMAVALGAAAESLGNGAAAVQTLTAFVAARRDGA